jgi:hypothetical protein
LTRHTWAFYWEINPTLASPNSNRHEEKDETSEKLRRYLERNPYKAKGIAIALHCIGDLLSDKKLLLNKYGLDVDFDDVDLTVSLFILSALFGS